MGHLVVGQLNQHLWQGGNDLKYREQLHENGAWGVSGPHLPAHGQGSALGTCVLSAGRDIPDAFLPLASRSRGGVEDKGVLTFSPAFSPPGTCIADCHPVQLFLPCSVP